MRRRALGGELAFVTSTGVIAGVLIAVYRDYSPFLLFAPIFVPTILGLAYFVFYRWEQRREHEQNWETEVELDQLRRKETLRRIETAKTSGAFDKWQK